jgi:hypothetical protein
MFFYNYIITKYEIARDASDYITNDEIEEYLLPKFMKGAKRGLSGYEQYKLMCVIRRYSSTNRFIHSGLHVIYVISTRHSRCNKYYTQCNCI